MVAPTKAGASKEQRRRFIWVSCPGAALDNKRRDPMLGKESNQRNGIDAGGFSAVDQKFVEEQPQVLRLRLAHNARQPPLRMTACFLMRTSDSGH
jgi:hypothetical protein